MRAYVYTWGRGDCLQSHLHLFPSLPHMVFCKGLIVETAGVPATSAGIRPLGAQHPIQTVFICKTRCPASTSKADLFPLLFPQASPDTFCTTSIDSASHHLPRDEGSPITLVLQGGPRRGAGDKAPLVSPGLLLPLLLGPTRGLGAGWSPAGAQPRHPRGRFCSRTGRRLMEALPFGSPRDYDVTAAGPGYSPRPGVLLLH